ncbi:hypothetical protein PUN28_000242 [Cardiocondyla obscurior]|uniref:Uncharacterized protein n=1 Tax=Cardiocondyla obscurior TaxID=286306 RepID=A0AAW2GYU3_9HYME
MVFRPYQFSLQNNSYRGAAPATPDAFPRPPPPLRMSRMHIFNAATVICTEKSHKPVKVQECQKKKENKESVDFIIERDEGGESNSCLSWAATRSRKCGSSSRE